MPNTEQKRVQGRERVLLEKAEEATAKFRAIFDQSAIFSGIMTLDGTVIDANRMCLEACGYRQEEILGRLFWETAWWRVNKDVQNKIRIATSLAVQGQPYREELEYHLADGTPRIVDFALHPIRDDNGKVIFLHLTGLDVTQRKQTEEELRYARTQLEKRVQERTEELRKANDGLRNLSARLLNARDNEARRVARELHDSVGQLVAAISMNIGKIKAESHKLSEEATKAVAENEIMVQQIGMEIRTISHLLHPPLLEELGLQSALRWCVDGFSERSGVRTTLEISPDLGRMSSEVETCIFRIVQECLTNIHRHSGSPTAEVRLARKDHEVVLEVRDFGKGLPEGWSQPTENGAKGVGFRGMVERVRYLRGGLSAQSDGRGTVVTAKLPWTDV
jgi:PAS domain S-box-containing protein